MMITNRCAVWGVALFVLLMPRWVFGFAEFVTFDKSEFAPTRGERFQIPFTLTEEADVKIELVTADGDVVRTLTSDKQLKKGRSQLAWDGKDQEGVLVPDEAYVAVIHATDAHGKVFRLDPRETSGGEIVEGLGGQITAEGHITYTLPAASRVLIRTGIKGGPMLRSLVNWVPRAGGKNVQRWDGFDQNQLFDLRAEKNLAILVTAFRLPQHSIITTGNKSLNYVAYRQKKGWPNRTVKSDEMMQQRGEQRLARQYYVSPERSLDPPVQLSLPKIIGKSATGLPMIKRGAQVSVQVNVDKKQRWLIDENLYEVAFFVDHEFVSEEEQGYVPLIWLWSASNLTPGQHLLTVNISGFDGKVGVASLLFEVEK